MKRLGGPLLACSALGALLLLIGGAASGRGDQPQPLHDAATGKLRPATLTTHVTRNGTAATFTKRLPFVSNGTLAAAREALGVGAADDRATGADAASSADIGGPALGSGPGTLGCSRRTQGAGNVRVNQDCSFRRQAEEEITFNPADPSNLLAGQNDSRVGFNQCGVDFSTDDGRRWGDLLPPFRGRFNAPQNDNEGAGRVHTVLGSAGTGHTYDAGSDPAVAFDSRGRGFFSCIIFDVNSSASGLYVTSSPIGAGGSFFFNVGNASPRFIVVEDNSPTVIHDKELIAADSFPSSPNRDNVYVTWTVFLFDDSGSFRQSPIFGSMSTDHGRTWSTPQEISGNNPAICDFGNAFDPSLNPNDCNFDQGSDPVVLPNGHLVVPFANANTPDVNGQILAVVCSPSGSSPAGSASLNCGPPVKVGDDIVQNGAGQSEPQCDFGQGPEECVPGAFIRTNDFPRSAVHQGNGDVFVAWQDFRNGEYDIQLARSTDAGSTWSPSVTVNPDSGLDHYLPATDIAETGGGDRVGVSYFRTEQVPGENASTPAGSFNVFAPGQPGVQQRNSDYALAGGTNLQAPFDFRVVSVVFPPPDGIQTGFNGDYSGLTINRGEEAHPIWSDTRNVDPFAPANGVLHDEDVFTDAVGLPNGVGKPGAGQIGRR